MKRLSIGRSLGRRFGYALLGVGLLGAAPAAAFPHVVGPGETLAGLAERFYGRIQLERVLVAANHLDRTGVRKLAPGMVLEVPALTYHRVQSGETWESLALELLGDGRRSIYFAESNGHKPWIQPELGQILAVPYNLAWVASGDESLATLAYRFLGSTKQAWALTQYNDLEKREIVRGEVLLLPLVDLPLTREGQAEARRAARNLDEQAQGERLREQSNSRSEISALSADVRAGRYVAALVRGAELKRHGELSAPLSAHVQRLLLEVYVALDSTAQARASCDEFRELEPDYEFDPITTSPKILAICGESRKPATEAKSTTTKSEGKQP